MHCVALGKAQKQGRYDGPLQYSDPPPSHCPSQMNPNSSSTTPWHLSWNYFNPQPPSTPIRAMDNTPHGNLGSPALKTLYNPYMQMFYAYKSSLKAPNTTPNETSFLKRQQDHGNWRRPRYLRRPRNSSVPRQRMGGRATCRCKNIRVYKRYIDDV